jgi:hypothetical protein
MKVLTYSTVLASWSHVIPHTVKFIVLITIPDIYVAIIISFLTQEEYSVPRSERWKKISFRLILDFIRRNSVTAYGWLWLRASHSHSTFVSMTATDNDEEDYCYGNVISLSPVLLLSMPKRSWLLTGPPMPNRFLACFRAKRDRFFSRPYIGDGAWVWHPQLVKTQLSLNSGNRESMALKRPEEL